MVLWFNKAFQLIATKTIEKYCYDNGHWRNVEDNYIAQTVDDILIRQEIKNAQVEAETITQPENQYHVEHKAYIVWYSGDNYEIRREVSITFWQSPQEQINPNQIYSWLDKASRSLLGSDLSNMESWHSAYVTLDAFTGNVRKEVGEYSSTLIKGEYTKENRLVRQPLFFQK